MTSPCRAASSPAFADLLPADQQVHDALAELGELATRPEANIIKLPNVSASLPQLKEAIAELQGDGFAIPDFPDDPQTPEEHDARARYDKVKGSAVNPVLREGNSDRRAPKSVKEYARKHPHSMGAWSADSKTRVATMATGDFFHNEESATMAEADVLRIEHIAPNGYATVLKESLPVLEGEIIDATFMSKSALEAFVAEQIAAAKAEGVLFSVHLKATMMKVSDPIIFGHVVRVFFADLFAAARRRRSTAAGFNPNDGMAALPAAIASLPDDQRAAIEATIAAAYANGPAVAMVDSDNGITNLHVPSDVIVDASMPAMIRTSGQMWNAAGEQQDTLAVMPDSSYAGIYEVVIDDCKANGAFDPATMGSVPNVGLMAQKAEEYGSHDKTFEIPADGVVRVVSHQHGGVIFEHDGRRRRHLAHVPGQGRPDPGLGQARGDPGPRQRHPRRVLAGRSPGPRCPAHRQGAPLPGRPRHRLASPSRSCRRPKRASTRSIASGSASTPSRSRATCCATTTPTCSRSSSWAPAPRCSRSCR